MDDYEGPATAASDGRSAWSKSQSASSLDERARTLSLIDFLTDYDSQRNPPVYDIAKYRLFLLRADGLPDSERVRLSPASDAWLTVDFVDLPQRPEVPEELTDLLGDSAGISPSQRPVVRAASDDLEHARQVADATNPVLAAAADRWIAAVWEPYAARWAEASTVKALHRMLFEQRELLASDRESVELVWGFGRMRWQHGYGGHGRSSAAHAH